MPNHTITTVYPTGGDTNVHERSHIIMDIVDNYGTALDLSLIDMYIAFGAQIDAAYPGIPDHYGASIDKNILTILATLADGDYRRVMYWGGASILFEPLADTLSVFTLITPSTARVKLMFDQPLGYGVSHAVRLRTEHATQVNEFRIQPRSFYSPAIGDTQSTLELYTHVTDLSAVIPHTNILRNTLLAAMDARDTTLAARRLMLLGLERNLGFPDYVTESDMIIGGARNVVYQQVSGPLGLKAIDTAMGSTGPAQTRAALKELISIPAIPRNWIEPAFAAMDFLNVDLTYRVRVAVQAVLVGFRASLEGLI